MMNEIGSVTMLQDGKLLLNLRIDDADGTVGTAQFIYEPNTWEYDDVIEHVGGLKPGESKMVPPWDNADEDDLSDLGEYDDLAPASKPRRR